MIKKIFLVIASSEVWNEGGRGMLGVWHADSAFSHRVQSLHLFSIGFLHFVVGFWFARCGRGSLVHLGFSLLLSTSWF